MAEAQWDEATAPVMTVTHARCTRKKQKNKKWLWPATVRLVHRINRILTVIFVQAMGVKGNESASRASACPRTADHALRVRMSSVIFSGLQFAR
jgi:hypothetical protein